MAKNVSSADLILETKFGQPIYVHADVLKAKSEYFRRLISTKLKDHNFDENNKVKIKMNERYPSLKKVIDYLYGREECFDFPDCDHVRPKICCSFKNLSAE